MVQRRRRFPALAALVLLLVVNSIAAAQATRTWVSGVGDDANPGSRTAPCKTFAGAISKTAAGGEIDCIDPGGFGAITITKSITIDGGGTFASILGSGTNAVIVNAGANDVVTIRNLSINGAGTGLNGIRFLAGGALHIENCVIFNFTQKGVDFEPSGTSKLFIKDTIIRNNAVGPNGGGVFINPGASGNAVALLDGVRMDGNFFGINAGVRSTITVRNSEIFGSTTNGILASGSAAAAIVINVENCMIASNAINGIRSAGSQSTIRISNVSVFNNNVGLATGGGNIVSFGNNRIAGNTTDGAPTATIAQN